MAKKTKNIPEPNNFETGNFGSQPMSDLLDQLGDILPGTQPEDDESITVEAKDIDEMNPMDDLELLQILNYHELQGKSFVQDQISQRAVLTTEYYYGEPTRTFAPPEAIGRSSFVSKDVQTTIDWALPVLMDVFCSTDDVVEFCARCPQHEAAADQTTALVNHVWKVQNDGYEITRTWITDGLMYPAGIIKVFWQPDVAKRTVQYKGLTDMQFKLIAMDPTIVVTKHTIRENPNSQQIQTNLQMQQGYQEYPSVPYTPILHDIVVIHDVDKDDNGKGQVKIVNVPLEQFYVDPWARRIEEAIYTAHVMPMPVSDLRAMGFDQELVDQVSNTQWDPEMTQTYLARTELQGSFANGYHNEQIDPSMRRVIVVEAYIKIDYFQTGIAEWRKITRCGNVILENIPVDGNPFIFITSNPLSNLLFGISMAEQAMNTQLANTQLKRALIDNVTLSANSQMWVVPENVNMDDALDQRPGGLVRVKDGNSIGVLQTSSGDVAATTALIGLLDTDKQESTGVMKLTQGSDADILNQTASGNAAMTDRSNQRLKLIARQFAETGFKPLALRIQKLLAMYQNDYMQIRINGVISQYDPQDAQNQYDVNVNVGLGTADKSKTIAGLQTILQMQTQAIQQQTGLCDLNLVHNTLDKIVKALGFASSQEFFKTPPAPVPQTNQQPDPKLVQIQTQGQIDNQQMERQAQLDAMKIQAQSQSDARESALDFQREMARLRFDEQMQRERMYLDAALQREQTALNAKVSPQIEDQYFNNSYESTVNTVNQEELLRAIINAPEPSGGNPNSGNPTIQ